MKKNWVKLNLKHFRDIKKENNKIRYNYQLINLFSRINKRLELEEMKGEINSICTPIDIKR